MSVIIFDDNFQHIKGFKSFYLKHFNAVAGFCLTYVKNKDIALDISQEAMYKVYVSYDSDYSYESTVSFLYTIARNACLDYLRRSKSKIESIDTLEDFFYDESMFLDEITRQETLNSIRRAIKMLKGRSYEIILLTLQGKSNNDIAEILGVSLNTVKTLKKTAFQKLRSLITRDQLFILICLPDIINY